jgi:hypothetical protein
MKLGISSQDLQAFIVTKLDIMKNMITMKVYVTQIQNWA